MSKKSIHLHAILPVVAGLITVPYAPIFAQTLQEAVITAIRTNPKILAANEEQQLFEERTKQAFSGYLPVINLSAARGEEWTSSPSSRSSGQGGMSLTRSELGVTFNQVLFDGMQTRYKVKQAEARHESKKASQRNVEETLALTVVEAYLDALLEQELLTLHDKNLELHKKILSKVKEMSEIGAGTEVDVQQSESRLALIASDREASLGSQLDAQSRFINSVGESPAKLVRPTLKKKLLPVSLEKALQMALDNHPSLIVSEMELEAAIAERKTVISSFLPTVSLALGASNTSNTSGTKSYTHNASAMLEMNYNLFRGGSDLAKKRELKKNINKSIENVEDARRKVLKEVESAWFALDTSRKRIRHIEKHLLVTEGVTQSYHDQFNMGIRSLLDVLDSEGELHTAKRSLLTEQYKFIKGTFKLLSAIGILHQTLIRPSEEVMQTFTTQNELFKASNQIIDNVVESDIFLPPLEWMIESNKDPLSTEKPSDDEGSTTTKRAAKIDKIGITVQTEASSQPELLPKSVQTPEISAMIDGLDADDNQTAAPLSPPEPFQENSNRQREEQFFVSLLSEQIFAKPERHHPESGTSEDHIQVEAYPGSNIVNTSQTQPIDLLNKRNCCNLNAKPGITEGNTVQSLRSEIQASIQSFEKSRDSVETITVIDYISLMESPLIHP
ncbi:MAG: TolC family outer membrane protein [Magnetococcales bacterium]|nr:TolC family outer membrane protein [Magnetococcales bacterium]